VREAETMHPATISTFLTLAMAVLPDRGSSAPVALQTAAPAAPIAVRSCALTTSRAGSVVWVSFTNALRSEADVVRIDVRAAGRSAFEVNDLGRFSPGVEIDHAFRTSADLVSPPGGPVVCTLRYAGFADGTSWSAVSR
jgi:hypothetical protein